MITTTVGLRRNRNTDTRASQTCCLPRNNANFPKRYVPYVRWSRYIPTLAIVSYPHHADGSNCSGRVRAGWGVAGGVHAALHVQRQLHGRQQQALG